MVKVCHLRKNNKILLCLICLFSHSFLTPPHCKDIQMQQNLKQNSNNIFLVTEAFSPEKTLTFVNPLYLPFISMLTPDRNFPKRSYFGET